MFKHTYWFPFFAQSKECHTNDAYTNVAKCVVAVLVTALQ